MNFIPHIFLCSETEIPGYSVGVPQADRFRNETVIRDKGHETQGMSPGVRKSAGISVDFRAGQ